MFIKYQNGFRQTLLRFGIVNSVNKLNTPNKILAFRQARGWTQQELAARCKTTQPQIDRLEKGLRKLTVEWLQVIGIALEVEPAALLPAQGSNQAQPQQLKRNVASRNQSGLEFMDRGHATFTGPRDLPILGYVKAGGRGFFIGNGDRQGVTVRPEPLRDVKDAYAVRVHDDSMSPALEPGYLLYVDPTRPIKPGDNVVIQLNDGQAFIKRLVRRTEKAMICKQYNPAQEIRYDPTKVKSVHLVVQVSMVDI